MSDILRKAREYEKQHEMDGAGETRPVYHFTPPIGWTNDPNGFSIYGGEYHLFYQHHPYSTSWGTIHWGHATSRDLLSWKHLPIALAPDEAYDKGGCFSGSACTLPDGRHLLLYTGFCKTLDANGSEQTLQTQCVATGDGVEYTKCARNPVICGKDLPEGYSTSDFRDPKIFSDGNGCFSCVVGCRTDDGSGAILLFQSPDGFDWHFVTVLDRSRNEYGKMWECPDFFPLDGKQVLLISPQEMQKDGPEFHDGDNTMAIIGSYDDASHRFTRERVQAVDYGIDFYAPQTLLTADGRRVMIAWLQNWATLDAKPENATWFGQMSTPRELTLRNGRLIQTPIRELAAYRGQRVAHANVLIGKETSLAGISGRVLDMTLDIRPIDGDLYRLFTIKVAKDQTHETVISYCPETSVLRLDRSRSGINHEVINARECYVRRQGGVLRLRILLDKCSVEVFVNDGEQTLSAAVYTDQTAQDITFEADGQAILSAEQYDICVL